MSDNRRYKPMGRVDAVELARNRLLEKHAFYGSWAAVKDETGINKGLACAIANGRRTPSDRVLSMLGIEYSRTVPVACCPHCGEPPLQKRHVCPARETKPRRRLAPPLVRLVAGLLATNHMEVKA